MCKRVVEVENAKRGVKKVCGGCGWILELENTVRDLGTCSRGQRQSTVIQKHVEMREKTLKTVKMVKKKWCGK